jgi:hypothetical protein
LSFSPYRGDLGPIKRALRAAQRATDDASLMAALERADRAAAAWLDAHGETEDAAASDARPAA